MLWKLKCRPKIQFSLAETGIARKRTGCLSPRMEVRNRDEQPPFTTKDGSTIRSLLRPHRKAARFSSSRGLAD